MVHEVFVFICAYCIVALFFFFFCKCKGNKYKLCEFCVDTKSDQNVEGRRFSFSSRHFDTGYTRKG